MEKYFRTEQGKLVDTIDYSLEQMKKNPNVKIHVACDSQVFGSKIKFVVVIVYRDGIRGAHCLHKLIKKERPPRSVPKEQQVLARLQEEVYLTMELAEYITNNTSIRLNAVEFDFNDQVIHMSNKLTSMALGWAKGMGFNAIIKPNELIACKYADHLARS